MKWLTGMTFDRRPVRFRPADVWSKPLIDAHGVRIGATFQPDQGGAVAQRAIRWAEQDTRQADTEVVPTRNVGQDRWIDSPPEDAPWAEAVRQSGQPPNYFFIHGTPDGDHFVVSVNRGTEAEEDWVEVKLNGRAGGQMLEAHENSARAIERNPAGEQVLVACRTGAPDASAARLASEYLHSTGTVTGNIHAPTDIASTPHPYADRAPTELYAERSGPNDQLFETYRGPGSDPGPAAGS
ncbi:hypothetical protein [Nocardia rhamnosiphila]|uniref:Uncharacterized protein n=1 Tax=Nocardia rhamnosiphila TaxID=426716 RepID=A0ABV2WT04_9NOCA